LLFPPLRETILLLPLLVISVQALLVDLLLLPLLPLLLSLRPALLPSLTLLLLLIISLLSLPLRSLFPLILSLFVSLPAMRPFLPGILFLGAGCHWPARPKQQRHPGDRGNGHAFKEINFHAGHSLLFS
jgi:hypothetical protein